MKKEAEKSIKSDQTAPCYPSLLSQGITIQNKQDLLRQCLYMWYKIFTVSMDRDWGILKFLQRAESLDVSP